MEHLEQHQEWRGKTLFIDGLDEVRAGSTDARSALDEIRRRLNALGRPRFRLSCREADWLGNNDRNRLQFASHNSSITILRLEPLTEEEIEQILHDHPSVKDPRHFIAAAQQRGVGALLANPQTLIMLADVVGDGERWPEGRSETFDMACSVMAREQNEEHSLAGPHPPLNRLLDAAGHLCVTQLITGSAGFSPDADDSHYVGLDSLGDTPRDFAHHAVSTRLFRSVDERRFAPVHRHVAEYLGARYLARRIEEGLSERRVVSLISGADGIVVAEMRGLSGWLAALCQQSRDLLTERDPVGVALYGDLSGFRTKEKRKLLEALGSRDALMRSGLDLRSSETVSILAPLTRPDMESTLQQILSQPTRDPEHQSLVEFVLSLLSRGAPLPNLSPSLLDIARDESRWQYVRLFAVDALIHSKTEPVRGAEDLKSLLEEIRLGTVTDPDGELKGALLAFLYPQAVPASRVWDYLSERSNPQLYGWHTHFWNHSLLEQSSDQDVAELLDDLSVRHADIWSALNSHHADDVPLRLLARGLHSHGDDLPLPRLYEWLSAAAPPQWGRHSTEAESAAEVRDWLTRRPKIQQALILHGLSRWPNGEWTVESEYLVHGPLHGIPPAANLGSWCLVQAVRLATSQPEASQFLMDEAFRAYQSNSVSLDLLRTQIAGIKALEEQLHRQLQQVSQARRSPGSDRRAAWEAKHEAERQKGIEYVREHAAALRQNAAPLSLLHDLGRAYFRYRVSQTKPQAPVDRIAQLLGGNGELVKAALSGLRSSPWRGELPAVEEVIRLNQTSRRHFLAYPVLAALDLLHRESPERLLDLSEEQMRTALAFHYCTPGGFSGEPAWHERWAALRPEVVAEVATSVAIAAMRRKDAHSPAVYVLADMGGPPDLKRHALLAVLSKFPPRARLDSLRTLDFLLWKLLDLRDKSALMQLIEIKLSSKSMTVAQRVHWLAAGIVAAPERYIERTTQFVRAEERRARHLAEFFNAGDPLESDCHEFSPAALRAMIELMGPSFAPDSLNASGTYTLEMKGSREIERFIRQLGAMPGEDGTQALAALMADQRLNKWRDYIERAQDLQRVLHRETFYSHPDIGVLHRVLDDREPASASDLVALVVDRLGGITSDIRSSNAEVWRQFWNEDFRGQPERLKHEDSCRDVLLAHLRTLLPPGVDAQPEGQHVGDKRSDIRVSYSEFSVPVEIKKVTHRDLWSALSTQLISKYTRDPGASGCGIYLVLWFAGAQMPPPPEGARPATPDELQARLQQTLADDEARKIDIVVIDVSQPS
ncbi:MAG: hypothetical protein OXT70_03610 [Chloroflexota bacterium]|nr:hypothetical protein [Chloroflexota bacterium]